MKFGFVYAIRDTALITPCSVGQEYHNDNMFLHNLFVCTSTGVACSLFSP